jgi:hypothetical protein
MTDLERTLRTLVDDPPAPPTDVDVLAHRAGRIRTRRRLATGAGAATVVALLALGAGVLLDGARTPAPVIAPPTTTAAPTDAPTAADTPSIPADDAPPTTAPTTAPTAGPTASDAPTTTAPTANPETDPPAWVTFDAVRAWQAETGRDGQWVAGWFLPPDWVDRPDAYELTPADLVVRWRLIDPEADDDREALIRTAFDALAGAEPGEGLVNALGGGAALDLVRFELSEDIGLYDEPAGRVTVVFTDEIGPSTATGTTGAIGIMQQMEAMLAHYFPEAAEGCIATVSAQYDPETTVLFHDMEVCPFPLRRG